MVTQAEIWENRNITSDFILLGLFTQDPPFPLHRRAENNHASPDSLGPLIAHTYVLPAQPALPHGYDAGPPIVPKMAGHYVTGRNSISPTGCGMQIIFLTLEGGECFLLAVMSYDHYVAICHTLRYPILMSWRLCLIMTWGSWFLGAGDGLMQAATTGASHFAGLKRLTISSMKRPLGCTWLVLTSVFEYTMYTCCVLMFLVHSSCCYPDAFCRACKKAFSTCSSHLALVGLFSGAALFIYMRPQSYRSANHDKVVSVLYYLHPCAELPCVQSEEQ
ncbi:olfactory receptor 2T12-like [Manis javanica]|uniref:olfactory receptor 2T12-like n=1 Tax=Manis javanica TaxID=9974 RepID=UPI003C6D49BD